MGKTISYFGERLNRVALPLGGMGAGMLCLEGTGALSHVSIHNRPDVYREPLLFAAVKLKDQPGPARVLEGPVPGWKVFGKHQSGNGNKGSSYGFPRFRTARFENQFPFGTIQLQEDALPLQCTIVGWSPFFPGGDDACSLPLAVVEYLLINSSGQNQEGTFSFHAHNFLAETDRPGSVGRLPRGLVLRQSNQSPSSSPAAALGVSIPRADISVDCAWFRGGWFDALTQVWNTVESGPIPDQDPFTEGSPSQGGSLGVNFRLKPSESIRVPVVLTWYDTHSDLRFGDDSKIEEEECRPTYSHWYGGAFPDIESVTEHSLKHLETWRAESEAFAECFFQSTLPSEVLDAVSSNLSILKSPTVLRQDDGRLWAWEGCHDERGCCYGSCTHVWNYAQALPHLFPRLERSLRSTEFHENQNTAGHQAFRADIPIRDKANHDFHSAADGQLGGIMKVYRDWRISGDSNWMRELWPKVEQSLEYCIQTWDPDEEGILREPHHNTYDIEFWGPNGMCISFYLGALKAGALLAAQFGGEPSRYENLLNSGREFMESHLFNGEYFIQQIQWKGLRAGSPLEVLAMDSDYSPEARKLLEKEGPKYQYGQGCLSDGVLGAWMAEVCGVGTLLDADKVRSHLLAVHRYNLKRDLSDHVNPQRPGYAFGREGGLLLCTWPGGGMPALPFVYSNEVWTGIEYQVASHLMRMGAVEEGLEIVRVARERYDGRVRNPFDEYECGHWYARAMASYALLQGLTGIRYDAVNKTLFFDAKLPGDFKSFLSTETGYGLAGLNQGEPFLEVWRGQIPVEKMIS